METSLKDPVDSGWIVVPRSTESPHPQDGAGACPTPPHTEKRQREGKREPTLPTGSLGTDRRFDGADSNITVPRESRRRCLGVPSRANIYMPPDGEASF